LEFRHGKRTVFNDFLTWTIAGFSISDELKWQPQGDYSKNEELIFWDIFKAYATAMSAEIKTDNDWYDLPGEYYERAEMGGHHGQFFTPKPVCTAMAQITVTDKPDESNSAADSSCGSGRMLLAANSVRRGMRMFATDLDPVCCHMCIVNFLMHGIEGEVVNKDALDTESYFSGCRVNEGLNNPLSKNLGFMHVRYLPKEESIIYRNGLSVKQKVANTPLTVVPAKKTEAIQMALF
jgi:type I restriction enzyme M protein